MAGTAFEIDERIAADAKLRRRLDVLVPELDPVAVYLFGSRANGTERLDSDYDLLVVLPDDAAAERLSTERAFWLGERAEVGADIVPCRHSVFEQSRDVVGTLSYEAAHFGKRVHAR